MALHNRELHARNDGSIPKVRNSNLW